MATDSKISKHANICQETHLKLSSYWHGAQFQISIAVLISIQQERHRFIYPKLLIF